MTTDTDLENQVRNLTDRAEILDCMTRYTRGVDRRDRALLRSAYHDGAIDDHGGGFVGDVDDFIDWAFAYHATQSRYQHYIVNHTAEVDGDTAHAETYFIFVGTDREPAGHMTISGGRYIDRLERRDGRWGIVARLCVPEWITESANMITDEVAAMLAPHQLPTKDRSDASYFRPLTLASPGD